jgi:hypothetical protein
VDGNSRMQSYAMCFDGGSEGSLFNQSVGPNRQSLTRAAE